MRRRSRTSKLPLHLTFMISHSIIAFPSKFWWIKCPQKLIGWIYLSKEWNHKWSRLTNQSKKWHQKSGMSKDW
ncbi:hypothetical protein B0H14DRAFT_2992357 [Mycena olivaceomarginata]|nr:hypothetical protein B0H14DRAFT_2992357 [Mycena olivaceomarginata]